MTRRFTGWHMTAILSGFFAIVIAVNFTMARLASSTFGGLLAENGYVASQDYNRWIAKARAQDRLGWTAQTTIEDGHLIIRTNAGGSATADVILVHPLGRVAEARPRMAAIANGVLRSLDPVSPGRWQAHVTIRAGGHAAHFLTEVKS